MLEKIKSIVPHLPAAILFSRNHMQKSTLNGVVFPPFLQHRVPQISTTTTITTSLPQSDNMPSLRTTYLVTYNTINALLWLYIFSSIILSPFQSPQTTYATLEPWTRWTQTIAILEILHAALGKPSPYHHIPNPYNIHHRTPITNCKEKA